jgi:hypothetical protein
MADDAEVNAPASAVRPNELGIHPMRAAVAVKLNSTTVVLAMINIGWARFFEALVMDEFILYFFLVR